MMQPKPSRRKSLEKGAANLLFGAPPLLQPRSDLVVFGSVPFYRITIAR